MILTKQMSCAKPVKGSGSPIHFIKYKTSQPTRPWLHYFVSPWPGRGEERGKREGWQHLASRSTPKSFGTLSHAQSSIFKLSRIASLFTGRELSRGIFSACVIGAEYCQVQTIVASPFLIAHHIGNWLLLSFCMLLYDTLRDACFYQLERFPEDLSGKIFVNNKNPSFSSDMPLWMQIVDFSLMFH